MVCPCCQCPSGQRRCEGECCNECRTLTGASNGYGINEVIGSVCPGLSPVTQSYDQPCSLNNFSDFDGIVAEWGPTGPFDLIKAEAIEKYTGSQCQFAVLTAVQLRSSISQGLDENGQCICYWFRPMYWYRVYFFIYRCGLGQWVNATDEIAKTSLFQVFDDGCNPCEPLNCPGATWTNGNPPALPAMPAEYPCTGPFSGCGNPFP